MPERKSEKPVLLLHKTRSVCPECLQILTADVFVRDNKVWIRKKCPKHGEFEDVYWGSFKMYQKAKKYAKDGRGVSNPNIKKDIPVCPLDCGLCNLHLSHTALGNIAVTNRCDLSCWYCFFFAKKAGYVYEPGLGHIRDMLSNLRNEKPVPCNAIQITGGEPCMRPDLVEIIKMAKEEGFDHVQLNTNGIRLSQDLEFMQKIREAGVNTIYLSFDGVSKKTNPKNHWEIPGVFENCRQAGIGVVLVPTVINNFNDHEVGDMIRFGFKHMDVVRSVNFQPVSLVGRMPRKEREKHRITIPDTIKRIEEQTNGMITEDDFFPVPTVMPITNFVEALTKKSEYALTAHFSCGMATYVFEKNGKMLPLPQFVDIDGLLEYLNEQAEEIKSGRNRYMTGLKMMFKLKSFIDKEKQPEGFSFAKIIYNALIKHDYNALGKFHHKSLFIGLMHFMDLYNYDIERVRRCCIHYAMPGGKIIPFCTFNVMPELYRDKDQESHGIPIKKWEKKVSRKLTDDFYKRNPRKLERSSLYRKTYAGFTGKRNKFLYNYAIKTTA